MLSINTWKIYLKASVIPARRWLQRWYQRTIIILSTQTFETQINFTRFALNEILLTNEPMDTKVISSSSSSNCSSSCCCCCCCSHRHKLQYHHVRIVLYHRHQQLMQSTRLLMTYDCSKKIKSFNFKLFINNVQVKIIT